MNDSKDVVDFFERCVSEIDPMRPQRRFVEKTPQHVLRARFIAKHFPASRMIHVVRDGRDCYCSSKSNPDIPQRESLRNFANYWRKCVRAGVRAENHNGAQRLSYEEFVSKPDVVVGNLMQFLDTDYEPSQLNHSVMVFDPRANTAAFNNLGKPITVASVGRWKTEMSEFEITAFEKIAGMELTLLGYPLTG